MHPNTTPMTRATRRRPKEGRSRVMPGGIRKVQVSKNIDALLSYALLREVLYTRTTQVNRRVQGRLTPPCPDEELPHRCSRGVRRDQGTTSAHAQTRKHHNVHKRTTFRKVIFAYLSYALLREILYTRTTHVKMRVHRPTYIVLSRRKFRHIDTPKVRPRGQGTISEHA